MPSGEFWLPDIILIQAIMFLKQMQPEIIFLEGQI